MTLVQGTPSPSGPPPPSPCSTPISVTLPIAHQPAHFTFMTSTVYSQLLLLESQLRKAGSGLVGSLMHPKYMEHCKDTGC